jgi:hypothetical protein
MRKNLIEPVPGQENTFRFITVAIAHPTSDAISQCPVENQCVVCGLAEEGLYWFYIIPIGYHHFVGGKLHGCHDIVLLCSLCRQNGLNYLEEFRNQLVQINAMDEQKKLKIDGHHFGAARALLADAEIPVAILEEKRKVLCEFYKKDVITDEDIRNVLKMQKRNGVDNFLTELGKDKHEFCLLWRRLFLEKLKPKFLSKAWSIDYVYT